MRKWPHGHDAARPCIVDEWITAVFEAAEKHDAAIPAIPVSATLKRVGTNHSIEETVDRAQLWEAQTPQVFRRQLLMEAYAKRGSKRRGRTRKREIHAPLAYQSHSDPSRGPARR